jgi:hypothetical protein
MPGSPLNAAASIGVELEKVRDAVYPQFQQDDTFLSMIQVRTDNLDVSDRLCRIPILVQPGSQFSQFTPDGSSMGVGSGEKYDDGVTTPVYFNQAVQITKEAEWATNSKEKSVVDVFKDSFKLNLRQFRSNIDVELGRFRNPRNGDFDRHGWTVDGFKLQQFSSQLRLSSLVCARWHLSRQHQRVDCRFGE